MFKKILLLCILPTMSYYSFGSEHSSVMVTKEALSSLKSFKDFYSPKSIKERYESASEIGVYHEKTLSLNRNDKYVIIHITSDVSSFDGLKTYLVTTDVLAPNSRFSITCSDIHNDIKAIVKNSECQEAIKKYAGIVITAQDLDTAKKIAP